MTRPRTNSNRPIAVVLRAPGTNCDAEMARCFERAGAAVRMVHLDRLIEEPELLDTAQLIGLPGGFSYGDDIASGRVFAVRLRTRLGDALRGAAARGVPMLGVCNGFQVMVQAGLLPGPAEGESWASHAGAPEVALATNASGRFIDDWVRVEYPPESVCVWTRGLVDEELDDAARDAISRLPLASGEGRFVASPQVIERLERRGQIAVRYLDNLNGSAGAIAGICDASGLIFGLMPHPDRYESWTRHPFWTRLDPARRAGDPPGLRMFLNAVAHVRRVREGASSGTPAAGAPIR